MYVKNIFKMLVIFEIMTNIIINYYCFSIKETPDTYITNTYSEMRNYR